MRLKNCELLAQFVTEGLTAAVAATVAVGHCWGTLSSSSSFFEFALVVVEEVEEVEAEAEDAAVASTISPPL